MSATPPSSATTTRPCDVGTDGARARVLLARRGGFKGGRPPLLRMGRAPDQDGVLVFVPGAGGRDPVCRLPPVLSETDVSLVGPFLNEPVHPVVVQQHRPDKQL